MSRIASRTTCGTAALLVASLGVLVSCHTPDMARGEATADAKEAPSLVPPPLLLRPISASVAEALNARIPFARGPNIPAAPFRIPATDESRGAALDCLATAVYYESAGEPIEGQQAVAQVVLNRVRHPAFPSSICGVVYQGSSLPTGCQFSFTCDGSLERTPDPRGWKEAMSVADAALSGFVAASVGLSTHYHTDQVVPYWATSLAKDAKIGAHIFYRWPGVLGQPGGFSQRYASRETDPSRLRVAALIAHGLWPGQSTEAAAAQLRMFAHAEPELVAMIDSLSPGSAAQSATFDAAFRRYFVPLDPTVQAADPSTEDGSAADSPPTSEPTQPPSLADFLADHRAAYRKATDRAGEFVAQTASDWQVYTGASVDLRAVLADLSGRLVKQSPCADSPSQHPWASADRVSATRLLRLSFRGQLLQSAKGRPQRVASPALQLWSDQIALAVFARITALSQGQSAADDMVRADVAGGYALVPLLERRLQDYERRGDDFTSLAQFLPTLLNDLPAVRAKVPDATPSTCAPAFVTASA